MRITKVTIENFGIYKDLCEFQFKYDQDRRVTLLKGENGSGKTTLLNSIKIGLYGPMISGTRKNDNAKYINLISNYLNKDALKNPFSRYHVELCVAANLQKFSGILIVRRAWSWRNNKLVEDVEISCNGKNLTESEIEEFFNVLYKLYPLELFELFYLDGEKIDQLSIFDSNLYSVIESSMNIDIFRTLKSDLESYAIKKHNSKNLEKLKNEKNYCEDLLENLSDNRDFMISEIEKMNDEEMSLSVHIQNLSKDISDSNENLPIQLQQKNLEFRDVKKLINKYLIEVVPLILLETEMKRLSYQLEKEEENNVSKIIEKTLSSELKSYILNSDRVALEEHQLNEVFNLIVDKFKCQIEIIHDVNPDEYRNIQILNSKLSIEVKNDVKIAFDRYNEIQKELKLLNESYLNYDEDRIEKLLVEILDHKNKLSLLQSKIKHTHDKVQQLEKQISLTRSKIENLNTEIWKAIKTENISNVLNNINTVIAQYIDLVTQRKMINIEKYTKEMFEELIRKKGFIVDVKISKGGIFLTTADENRLLVSNLSSGEKQLFVLSILYAVLKVSERSTPLIFDTLLGRLDKNHQQEVMSKFISSCPDQVIVLATDSELENINKETLKELVNTQYSIDLSKENNRIEMIS